MFVGILFLFALFFSPLAGMIPAYASAAALLFVACVMASLMAELDWEDITEAAPAVIAAITMPLTYSIATGIGLGFITYALIKLIAGRYKDVSIAVAVLASSSPSSSSWCRADEHRPVVLAILGGPLRPVCRADSDLRQDRC